MHHIVGIDYSTQNVPNNVSEFSSYFSSNSGNLLFHYATEKIIETDKFVYNWNLEKLDGKHDNISLVIPMANQIGPHVDLSKNGPKISNLNVPIIVLGIGAQFGSTDTDKAKEIPQGTIEWLKMVSKNSKGDKNIAVRGRFTRDILSEYGLKDKIEVIGCQSNFISSEKSLGEAIRHRFLNLSKEVIERDFCVTAGDYNKKNLHVLERSLISIIEGKRGSYIVQNPKSLIALANGWEEDVPANILNDIHAAWLPHIGEESIFDWFKYHSSVYVSVPQWLLEISKKSMVVGTRIHGVQAALQAGTPALCLCIDSRTSELCSLMSIPHVNARKYKSGITLDECLYEFDRWDYHRYDSIRIMLAKKMKRFIIKNGAKPTRHLIDLTE